VNLAPKPNNDERVKRRLNFFVEWMSKLSAAFRTEISLETQAMYLEALSDLPIDRLNEAFMRAVRQCTFLPSIAEIRKFESEVSVPQEQLEAAYERMRQRVIAQGAIPTLRSLREVKQISAPKISEQEKETTL
jgi:hypothetical protein